MPSRLSNPEKPPTQTPPSAPPASRWPVIVGVGSIVIGILGVTLVFARTTWAVDPSPFDGASLYVNPTSNAALAAAAAEGDQQSAAQLRKLASQPTAMWLGDWNPEGTLTSTVASHVATVAASGALPLLVVYDIPGRDCGQFSSGGEADADAYRSWMTSFAAGIDQAPAAVIVEPDALAQMDCLSAKGQNARIGLIKFAVGSLAAYPNVSVYIDAGHSSWIPAQAMAERLIAAGISEARGFSLNVSNFRPTEDEVAYGNQISDLVGGKPFVIDTSRNGAGAPDGVDAWCNPPGRALGSAPLSPSGESQVDALLWIKTPGASDGECGRGEPPAGTFWPDYAVGLVDRSSLQANAVQSEGDSS